VVGGYAVGYFGYPRATGDLDIWVAVNPANARKIVAALDGFGIPQEGLAPDIFLEKDKIIRIGNPPLRVEIITGASGVTFSDCFNRRVLADAGDMTINLISRDDLLTNKKAAGRHKDLEDCHQLQSKKKTH
jgi:hypothetical protein